MDTRNFTTQTEEDILATLTVDNLTGDKMTADQKKFAVETLLRGTNRNGIENIISFLNSSDYYTAPSSTKYHSNYDGGLLDHSLLVLATAMKIRRTLIDLDPTLVDRLPVDSIIITTLLHDICKCGFYVKIDKWKKDASNNWVPYPGYDVNDRFPIGHGEKSVIMLQKLGLDLTAEEMLAIRWHMGSWDGSMMGDGKNAFLRAIDFSPIVAIVQNADNMSSLVLEKVKTY